MADPFCLSSPFAGIDTFEDIHVPVWQSCLSLAPRLRIRGLVLCRGVDDHWRDSRVRGGAQVGGIGEMLKICRVVVLLLQERKSLILPIPHSSQELGHIDSFRLHLN